MDCVLFMLTLKEISCIIIAYQISMGFFRCRHLQWLCGCWRRIYRNAWLHYEGCDMPSLGLWYPSYDFIMYDISKIINYTFQSLFFVVKIASNQFTWDTHVSFDSIVPKKDMCKECYIWYFVNEEFPFSLTFREKIL